MNVTEVTTMDAAMHAWRSWRGRGFVGGFLEVLRALDDDPVLMCGCPTGVPCGGATAEVAG